MLGFRKRTEPWKVTEAQAEANRTMHELARILFTPMLLWLDRQLRRSPRLYRWLSR